jgi:hypothetical protein
METALMRLPHWDCLVLASLLILTSFPFWSPFSRRFPTIFEEMIRIIKLRLRNPVARFSCLMGERTGNTIHSDQQMPLGVAHQSPVQKMVGTCSTIPHIFQASGNSLKYKRWKLTFSSLYWNVWMKMLTLDMWGMLPTSGIVVICCYNRELS